MKIKQHPVSITAIAIALALGFATTESRAGDAEALDALGPAVVRDNVEKLTCEEFAGRGAGEDGGRKASDWLAAELKAIGLKPAGEEGSWFQPFTVGKKSMRNVIGSIEGTTDEVVVFGAHYDHLGTGHAGGMLDPIAGKGKVHHGADDNASGTAGVLSLARAFSLSGEKPRRTLVFILFDGEEAGLLGSRRFVRAPTIPLERVVAMVNMDMIGRARGKLTVYGSNTGSGLKDLVTEAARGVDLELVLKETMPPNSDHHSFYKKNIPSIALFTGLHKDYHRASDTAEKLDYEGEAKVLKIAYGIGRGLARGEDRPTFAKAKDGTIESMIEQMQALLDDEELMKPFGGRKGVERMIERLMGRQKRQEEGGEPERPREARGDGRPRLGVQLDTESDGDGVIVQSVSEDSIAEKAGMLDGDAIVEMGGDKITSYDELRAAVGKARGRTPIVVLRGGKRVELEAEFPEAPKKRWF